MTLCVVSSNEDAQQQQSNSSSNDAMEATGSNAAPAAGAGNQLRKQASQDSGYGASQPLAASAAAQQPPARKYFGQNLRITASANQGGRKYMEDRVHVHVHRNAATDDIEWTYVAVYDGHGGPEASEYCRRHLLKNIKAEKGFDSEDDAEFLEAIRNGYLTTHHTMWKDVDSWARTASGYPSTAGTTASCAFIRRGKVYVGHVGDSAILLTTRSSAERFYRLTEDHKPELPNEKKRIEASGGAIMQKQYVYRVVWTRASHGHVGPIRKNTPTQTIPFLAVARSLGDFWSYIESTQEFAVSPVPDVSVHELTADHHSLVLASDGLTNVMSADLEAAIMHDLAEEEHQRNWFKGEGEQPNHARIMMRRTLLNWRRFRADNVSVLAVIFGADKRAVDDDDEEEEGAVFDGDEQDETLTPPASPSLDAPVELSTCDDVDAQLAEHPTAMVHVTNERVVRYTTAPVALRYNGQFDNNFHSVGSVGPGFVSHDVEAAAIAELMSSSASSESSDDASDEGGRCRPSSSTTPFARLQQYYDMLGIGERDRTPENQPPPTATHNLTNRVSMLVEKKSAPVFTSAAAIIIDELRRGGDATAAAAASAAASVAAAAASGADDDAARPVTPENRPDALFAVLRVSSRSINKRKATGRLERPDEDPSTSAAAREGEYAGEGKEKEEGMDESESESPSPDGVALKLALPFVEYEKEEEEKEEAADREELMMRTPSPIGDAADGGMIVVRATPIVNTVATEREVVKRVTRSAAASTAVSSVREMVVVERPATRRSSARRLMHVTIGEDAAAAPPAAASPVPAPAAATFGPSPARTPKMVLEVDDTHASIASRTRSRNGEVTPPGSAYRPATSTSGSRKRPRAAGGGGAALTSTATPLLARISLAEMNENASSSADDADDDAPATTKQSGATNKSAPTDSPWVRVLAEGEEVGGERGEVVNGEGEEQRFYEVVPAIDNNDDEAEEEGDGAPPAKRFRLWGMLKKWWSGGD